MPCTDHCGGMGWSDDNVLQKRLDRATQLLCYLCGELDDSQMLTYAHKAWWAEHKRADTERVRKQLEKSAAQGRYDPKDMARQLVAEAGRVHPVSDFHRKWFLELAEEVASKWESKWAETDKKNQLKQSALDKLTEEERKSLGL